MTRGEALERAHEHEVAGRFEEAASAYEAMLAIDTNDSLAAYNLGVMRFQAGDVEGAIIGFTRAVAIDASDASAWFNRGVCYARKAAAAGHFMALGDQTTIVGGPGTKWFEYAINDYTRALALGEEPHYLVNRANCLYALGRREAAIADARRAVELGDPKAPRLLHEVFGVD